MIRTDAARNSETSGLRLNPSQLQKKTALRREPTEKEAGCAKKICEVPVFGVLHIGVSISHAPSVQLVWWFLLDMIIFKCFWGAQLEDTASKR